MLYNLQYTVAEIHVSFHMLQGIHSLSEMATERALSAHSFDLHLLSMYSELGLGKTEVNNLKTLASGIWHFNGGKHVISSQKG